MDMINNRICQSIENHLSKIALINQSMSITYSEMNGYIKQYMFDIMEKCSWKMEGRFILIYLRSPLEAIIAQLAVLQCGAICVPLDRKTSLGYYSFEGFEDIACMITDDFESNEIINFPTLHISSLLDVNPINEAIQIDKFSGFEAQHTHCIMTSGTTGKPKAILLKQKAILNQIDAKIQLLGMNKDSKVCLSMGLSFVASIWQVLATLFVGGTLIVLDENSKQSPYDILKKADEMQATILCIVPSVLQAYLIIIKNRTRKLLLSNLSTIILTGELLHRSLVELFYHEYNIQLINAYGQTECSDDTFHYIIPKELRNQPSDMIPIGYPIVNIEFAIVDEFGNEVLKGDKGELCITGLCLSDGYLKDLELNDRAFRPINGLCGIRAFCTGDIVSQLDNEALVCYGRIDNQIKIHGYRIEPEAIESCYLSFPGICDALVVREETATDAYLQLQYILQEGVAVTVNELREYLSKKLPQYMIPSVYTKVDKIKYNEHGKKVRSVNTKKIEMNDVQPSKNNILKLIEMVYKKNMGRTLDNSISLNDDFLSLLNSIEFINLVVGLEEALNIEFDDEKLLFSAFPTLNDLLDYLLLKLRF